jgi:hypothetical protein
MRASPAARVGFAMQGLAWPMRYDHSDSAGPMRAAGALRTQREIMPRPPPSFPAFDEWQRMSELEQDALLDRLEAARRRGSPLKRLWIWALCAVACAMAGALLLAMRP